MTTFPAYTGELPSFMLNKQPAAKDLKIVFKYLDGMASTKGNLDSIKTIFTYHRKRPFNNLALDLMTKKQLRHLNHQVAEGTSKHPDLDFKAAIEHYSVIKEYTLDEEASNYKEMRDRKSFCRHLYLYAILPQEIENEKTARRNLQMYEDLKATVPSYTDRVLKLIANREQVDTTFNTGIRLVSEFNSLPHVLAAYCIDERTYMSSIRNYEKELDSLGYENLLEYGVKGQIERGMLTVEYLLSF